MYGLLEYVKRSEKGWLSVVGSVIVRGKGEGDVGGQLRVNDGRGERRADRRALCEFFGMSRCSFRMVRLFRRMSGSVCLLEKKRQKASSNAWVVQVESATSLV